MKLKSIPFLLVTVILLNVYRITSVADDEFNYDVNCTLSCSDSNISDYFNDQNLAKNEEHSLKRNECFISGVLQNITIMRVYIEKEEFLEDTSTSFDCLNIFLSRLYDLVNGGYRTADTSFLLNSKPIQISCFIKIFTRCIQKENYSKNDMCCDWKFGQDNNLTDMCCNCSLNSLNNFVKGYHIGNYSNYNLFECNNDSSRIFSNCLKNRFFIDDKEVPFSECNILTAVERMTNRTENITCNNMFYAMFNMNNKTHIFPYQRNFSYWTDYCCQNKSATSKDQCILQLEMCYYKNSTNELNTTNTKCLANCLSCNITSSECNVCKEGWFGEHCDTKCYKTCVNDMCNNETGMCMLCIPGWFGEVCNQKCSHNCDLCIDNTTCIECRDGFYGEKCENNCSHDCTKCSKDGKHCPVCNTKNDFGAICECKVNECKTYSPMLHCLECKRPGWYVSMGGCCPCSNNCIGGNINCETSTGACKDGCREGYYGDKCNKECNSKCYGNDSVCNSTTGECSNGCAEGWYFEDCSYDCSLFYPHCSKCSNFSDNVYKSAKCTECIDGYYMSKMYKMTKHVQPHLSDYCISCKHCLNQKCDGRTGICTEGCNEIGQYNSNEYINGEKYCVLKCTTCNDLKCDFTNGTCLDGCVSGYYGSLCDKVCSKTCVNGTCKQTTGHCHMCHIGYYGHTCNQSCGQCVKENCHQITGECEGGCLDGYYDTKCDKQCSNCIGNKCNIAGMCYHGCKPGKYGQTCNNTCPENCLVCHPEDGLCVVSKALLTNTIYLLNVSMEACHKGTYGIYCNISCGIGCQKSVDDLFNCDRFTGHCARCRKGYRGIACAYKCNSTCIDAECSRDGTCLKGCIFRWQGKFCQTYFPETLFEKLAGILFAVMVFVVFVLTVACVIHKRKIWHQRHDCTPAASLFLNRHYRKIDFA